MTMRIIRPVSRPPLLFLLCASITLAGCGGDPLFNVLGSYFPAWMICLFAGVVLTLVVRWFFKRIDLERYVRPLVIVYPALVTFFTCTIWLVLFS
jgi:hypothetical protein